MPKTQEKDFEEAIVDSLVNHDEYVEGNKKDYNSSLALFPDDFFSFIQSTQPDKWEHSEDIHKEQSKTKILYRLQQELETRGTLDVLRHGFKDYGVSYDLAYFKPESTLNPEHLELYTKNILKITRQVHYSKKNDNSIDLLISLNGLPIATIELKNPFTGQTVRDAEEQYNATRDPKELLFQFKKRALVHFSVDPDEVFMTTKLDGDKTKFLPFNKGYNNGSGNPQNPKGYKTSYLWQEILTKDSLMDIIKKFLHLEQETFTIDGKTKKKEKLIFPRYHQLDVVRKLQEDARTKGPGINYLIEHSAGSGKSNSIAWLSYRLSSLHNELDESVFDGVIVVTDRVVLNKQLQDTIYQFEHKRGVVEKIEKGSTQLAEALQRGSRIIITTLQTFPFVLDKIHSLPDRNYAVIVDEAHSSQGGESSRKLKETLMVKNDDLETLVEDTEGNSEDEIRRIMESRGRQPNLSFFAFTATPKQKTLEVFGTPDADGKPHPFHLYSMRQAIEEGFILDVLQHYTTYKTYYRISKQIQDDPQLNRNKARKALARFVSLHPHNISQKTEVMVEHFRNVTMKKIGGKAKAMVVTSSRLHAVRYYQEFNHYLKENNYKDIRTLVAFSGIVKDENGSEYKETTLNGFGEKELPEKFNTGEYRILLVADKYQTGFDQPLLHTMYVDKPLSGVKAVQTLSRLNRVHPGKEDTFILDFVNDEEDIKNAFQPYYEATSLSETTDPNRLYDMMNDLEGYHVTRQQEIENFTQTFYKPRQLLTLRDHAELNRWIDPAVDRYNALEKDDAEDYKHTLSVFLRTYSYLSQVMPFTDVDLEKYYSYGKLLFSKLPKSGPGEKVQLYDDVMLEYYRLQKIKEGSIELEPSGGEELQPPRGTGKRAEKETRAPLSEIIRIINERFGTDWTEADKLFLDQLEEDLVSDEQLQLQAHSNTLDNYRYGFNDVFLDKLIARMEQNQDIFAKIMNNSNLATAVKEYLSKRVYKRQRDEKDE